MNKPEPIEAQEPDDEPSEDAVNAAFAEAERDRRELLNPPIPSRLVH